MNVLRLLSVVSLVSVFTVSCGGGSKSEDPVAVCKQGCNKAADLCAADFGVTPAQFKALCESSCTSTMGPSGMTCTNSSAIISAVKACQSKTTCDEYTSCFESVPECQGGGSTGTGGASGTGTGGASGTGTGGRSGTGGASATGGASGTGGSTGAASCDAVLACCNASTNATVKTVCMAQYESIKTAGEATCAMVLTQLKDGNVCP